MADGNLNGLSGAQRDAYVALRSLFASFGLGSLSGQILGFVQQGYASDTVALMLQDTREYKERFKGNDARLKAGLPVLSPAEYLSLETGYRQVLQAGGMPKGFYDQHDDFVEMISKDVSVDELNERVNLAVDYAQNKTNPEYRNALKKFYGLEGSDLAAYFLDQKRAVPLLKKQAATVDIGAAAARQGFDVSRGRATRYAGLGVTEEAAISGYANVASVLPDTEKLGSIYGDEYKMFDAEEEFLASDASARRKREKLAEKEQSSFSGSSGVQKGSLDRKGSGSY